MCLQNKRDEQMMKRRNMAVEPESPLTESNKQVSVMCGHTGETVLWSSGQVCLALIGQSLHVIAHTGIL